MPAFAKIGDDIRKYSVQMTHCLLGSRSISRLFVTDQINPNRGQGNCTKQNYDAPAYAEKSAAHRQDDPCQDAACEVELRQKSADDCERQPFSTKTFRG